MQITKPIEASEPNTTTRLLVLVTGVQLEVLTQTGLHVHLTVQPKPTQTGVSVDHPSNTMSFRTIRGTLYNGVFYTQDAQTRFFLPVSQSIWFRRLQASRLVNRGG